MPQLIPFSFPMLTHSAVGDRSRQMWQNNDSEGSGLSRVSLPIEDEITKDNGITMNQSSITVQTYLKQTRRVSLSCCWVSTKDFICWMRARQDKFLDFKHVIVHLQCLMFFLRFYDFLSQHLGRHHRQLLEVDKCTHLFSRPQQYIPKRIHTVALDVMTDEMTCYFISSPTKTSMNIPLYQVLLERNMSG
jgi:hypothetical protein